MVVMLQWEEQRSKAQGGSYGWWNKYDLSSTWDSLGDCDCVVGLLVGLSLFWCWDWAAENCLGGGWGEVWGKTKSCGSFSSGRQTCFELVSRLLTSFGFKNELEPPGNIMSAEDYDHMHARHYPHPPRYTHAPSRKPTRSKQTRKPFHQQCKWMTECCDRRVDRCTQTDRYGYRQT